MGPGRKAQTIYLGQLMTSWPERVLIMVQERSQRSKLEASVGTEVGKQFKETDGRKMKNEPGSSI